MFGKKGPKDVVIGTPRDIQHNIHVNKDLDWHIRDPDTSFKLEEKLGEGSFGVVYKAMHLDSLHEIAVKIIEVDLAQTTDLQNEISILKKCMHSNIVSYFGSCATPKKLWILMDYCGLGSVRDVMETCKRTLTEKEIACILAGTLQGLRYLHHHYDQPIIHKDIKAANILLNEQGEVKLADFGVAQQILTTLCLGYLEGTPHFMAPEMGNAARFNYKADIWSLGITAIEMADGRPPYADINIMRAIHMIRRYDPPTLREPKKWSREFNDFISKCLVKDYNNRASSEDLLQHPFITGAKTQAMRDLCHEALKAKKKARTKLKKDSPHFSLTSPHSPPISSMAKWRTAKSRSLVVRSTFERGNIGSVVIMNTVNVRGSYNSASDDSSLSTLASSSSRDTKTGASLSSSGSPFGTVQINGNGTVQYNEHGTVQIKEHGTVQFNESGSGTVQFNESGSGTVRFNENGTVQFHETIIEEDESKAYGTVQFNETIPERGSETVRFHDTSDSDSAPRPISRKKRPLSSSLSSLPSPQVLSETDECTTDGHMGGTDTAGEVETVPKATTIVIKHDSTVSTKETRSIGVQTDLPLDFKLFMDSMMRKKRHKHYTETLELKDYKRRETKLSSSAGANGKRHLLDRLTTHNKSQLNDYHEINSPNRKLAISSSSVEDIEGHRESPKPKVPRVPPLPPLPLLDLTTSGDSGKHSHAKSPRTPKEPKAPKEKAPKEPKQPKTPKGSKNKESESKDDPAPSPRKSPRRKFAITEYLSGLLPNVVASPILGLYSSMDSSENEPMLLFSPAATNSLSSSTESSVVSCSPPSSPTSSSIDTALDSSLDSLRSSLSSPHLAPVTLHIQADEERISTNRESPYITPYSTTDESSDSAPATTTIIHTPPFAASPAPFTGPLLCKSPDTQPNSLLLSPPMTASALFIKNTTPDITPDTTPITSPDVTPRVDIIIDKPITEPANVQDGESSGSEPARDLDSALLGHALNLSNPGTPRPLGSSRNPSPLTLPDVGRVLARSNATSKLGDQVRAALLHDLDELENDPTLLPAVELTVGSSTPEPVQPKLNPLPTTPTASLSPSKIPRINSPTPSKQTKTSNHRISHSAPVLPFPPLLNKHLASASETATKPLTQSKSTILTPAPPKPTMPSKLMRTTSLRTLLPHTSEKTTSFPREAIPAPSVENIKQSLLLSTSPPKPAPLKRTASILNSNVIAAFLPKASTPPPPPQTTVTPTNTMVKNLSMAFSVPESTPARPRSNSSSGSPTLTSPQASPATRGRASTISGVSSPLAKPSASIPIPKPNSNASQPTTNTISASPSSTSPISTSPTFVLTSNSSNTSPGTSTPQVSRIPGRSPSTNLTNSYAAMRQKSAIPLPKTTPRARSATDVTKATLDSPLSKANFKSGSTLPPIPDIATPSSPEIPDSTDSCLSDIPPLSLTPSPPSTPPSSRSPSPESSSPSPRTSPRTKSEAKSTLGLLASAASRPFNRHSQHALDAAQIQARTRSTPTKSNRVSPQVSPSPLRRTFSNAIIAAPRSNSASSFASSSPSPSEKHTKKSPREIADNTKAADKAKAPRSPKEITEKPTSPKEGFSIRLPGGMKFPSYAPRSPRKSRNSPRSPRPSSAAKKSNPPSPLSPPFSPEIKK